MAPKNPCQPPLASAAADPAPTSTTNDAPPTFAHVVMGLLAVDAIASTAITAPMSTVTLLPTR
jgi:hypothetical protein